MPTYRHRESNGSADDIVVIEDKGMFVKHLDGSWAPGFEFIDSYTVRAHPFIIESLLLDSERVYTEKELRAFMRDLERLPIQ